jgi:hypothetical protein
MDASSDQTRAETPGADLELKPVPPLPPLPPAVELLPSQPASPFEPEPVADSFACRVYEWVYRGFDLCRRGLLWWNIFQLADRPIFWFALLVLTIVFGFVVLAACTAAVGLLLLGYCATLLVRVVMLTFFFARFSLGQLMLFVMLGGFCGSLIVVFPERWKALPAAALVLLFWIASVYVRSYDPFEREKILPRDAREILFSPPDAPKREPPPLPDEEVSTD